MRKRRDVRMRSQDVCIKGSEINVPILLKELLMVQASPTVVLDEQLRPSCDAFDATAARDHDR